MDKKEKILLAGWFLAAIFSLLSSSLAADRQDKGVIVLGPENADSSLPALEDVTLPSLRLLSPFSDDPLTTEMLVRPRVVLAFVLPPSQCPSCTELIDVLSVLAWAVPEAQFVIVSREGGEALQQMLAPLLSSPSEETPHAPVQVALDTDLKLVRLLRVQRVPTL